MDPAQKMSKEKLLKADQTVLTSRQPQEVSTRWVSRCHILRVAEPKARLMTVNDFSEKRALHENVRDVEEGYDDVLISRLYEYVFYPDLELSSVKCA